MSKAGTQSSSLQRDSVVVNYLTAVQPLQMAGDPLLVTSTTTTAAPRRDRRSEAPTAGVSLFHFTFEESEETVSLFYFFTFFTSFSFSPSLSFSEFTLISQPIFSAEARK